MRERWAAEQEAKSNARKMIKASFPFIPKKKGAA
jgi:hypothetical protein